MRWQGDIEQFVSSFLVALPDKAPLRQALTSIPPERWWAVWSRIVVELDNEMVGRLPKVPGVAGAVAKVSTRSQEDDEVLAMIELKERLLHQEGHRRLTNETNEPQKGIDRQDIGTQ